MLVLAGSLLSCGKEAKEKHSTTPERVRDPVEGEIENLLAQQSVDCDRGLACPSGVAKVVVVNQNKLKFCTGFLVSAKALATSSSCLTEGLRLSTDPARCQREVHVFFAKSGFQDEIRVGCSKILLASGIQGRDPVLWRNDIAYIELDRPVSRSRFLLSRTGVAEDQSLTMWKVDADNDQLGVIRRATCWPVLGGYVNPLADSAFSPGVVMAGCPFVEGNQGAALVGRDRRDWFGIVSQPMDQRLATFFTDSGRLTEALQPIIHGSNAACLPSVIENDGVVERDCFRDLDYGQVDRRRGELLGNDRVHESNRLRLLDLALQVIRPYFKWDLQLVPSGSTLRTRLVPQCLQPIRGWIGRVGNSSSFTFSVEIPDWRLETAFNGRGKVVSRLTEASERRRVVVEFSPRSVRTARQTTVNVTMDGRTEHYSNLSETCPKPLDGDSAEF